MKVNYFKAMEILDFEKEVELEIIVNEVSIGNFEAHFEGCDIVNNFMNNCNKGTGNSVDEALASLAKNISGKPFVLAKRSSYGLVPKLKHTIQEQELES